MTSTSKNNFGGRTNRRGGFISSTPPTGLARRVELPDMDLARRLGWVSLKPAEPGKEKLRKHQELAHWHSDSPQYRTGYTRLWRAKHPGDAAARYAASKIKK